MEQPIRSSSHFRIMAVLITIMLIVVIVLVLTFWTTSRMIRDRDAIALDHHILAELQETRALIDDAEDQHRGYLLTGDTSLLAPFDVDGFVPRFQDKLALLRAMLAGSSAQLQRLDRLRAAAMEKYAGMKSTIETRLQARPREARREVAAEIRREPRDPARAILLEMVSAERDLLQTRIDGARSNNSRAMVLLVLLLLLLLGGLVAFFWMVWRNLQRQARSATDLQKSREQFELAVRGSNDGLWDWDIDVKSVYYSPRWKSQLGYEDQEITHQFHEFESRLHPDDHDRVLKTVHDYLEGRLGQYSVEFRMQAKDASYRWILARGVALRDAQGKPFRMAGSHTDITDRKEVERKLADQNRLLERAMRTELETNEALRQAQAVMVQNEKMVGLGQMVAGVAHEINNPLSFITNNVTVLQRDFHELQQVIRLYEAARSAIAREAPDLDRQIADFRSQVEFDETLAALPDLLARTSEGLKRIRQIVKDLRLFARLDEGDVNEADLNEGIQSTATIIKGHAKDKDVRVKLALQPLPPVTCHAARVNQVVMNLLSNAIDACAPGGTILVRTSAIDSQVQIEVIDDGHGISPAIVDRIFDPFFTTKPIGKGTGLGLSISFSIVRDHGGTITVDSTLGKGSRFTVRLPVHPSLSPTRWPEFTEEDSGAPAPGPAAQEAQPT
jgi:PAS domain S-box-containing protein